MQVGVDEAGRGALCGPVVASAVALDPARPIRGVKDSKRLTPAQRERLFEVILNDAWAVGIGRATEREVEDLNVLSASLLAMERALNALSFEPTLALIDGNKVPDMPFPMQAVVQGDRTIPEISAASIVAKVTRDRECLLFDEEYPGYGFARHKGYATTEHLTALRLFGVTPWHRKTYAPVAALLADK